MADSIPRIMLHDNANKLIEAILNVPLDMRDATALYEGIDHTNWRDGTDTYLWVRLTNGTELEVAEAKPIPIQVTPGSPLALRGVHLRYQLTIAYNEDTPSIPDHELYTRRCVESLELYEDEIACAAIRAY